MIRVKYIDLRGLKYILGTEKILWGPTEFLKLNLKELEGSDRY